MAKKSGAEPTAETPGRRAANPDSSLRASVPLRLKSSALLGSDRHASPASKSCSTKRVSVKIVQITYLSLNPKPPCCGIGCSGSENKGNPAQDKRLRISASERRSSISHRRFSSANGVLQPVIGVFRQRTAFFNQSLPFSASQRRSSTGHRRSYPHQRRSSIGPRRFPQRTAILHRTSAFFGGEREAWVQLRRAPALNSVFARERRFPAENEKFQRRTACFNRASPFSSGELDRSEAADGLSSGRISLREARQLESAPSAVAF